MSNTFKLTIPAGIKAGACANRNECKWAATSHSLVYTAGESTYLAATDGRTLSILPVEIDGQIDRSTMLLPATSVNANGSPATVEVNGEVRTTVGKKTTVNPVPEQVGIFPAIAHVFPKPADIADYRAVILDAKLLSQLASAISSSGILTLLIPEAGKSGMVEKPIVAVGRDEGAMRQGIGLIMPLSGDKSKDTDRNHYACHVGNAPTHVKIG